MKRYQRPMKRAVHRFDRKRLKEESEERTKKAKARGKVNEPKG